MQGVSLHVVPSVTIAPACSRLYGPLRPPALRTAAQRWSISESLRTYVGLNSSLHRKESTAVVIARAASSLPSKLCAASTYTLPFCAAAANAIACTFGAAKRYLRAARHGRDTIKGAVDCLCLST
jgi:hypothetical protein